MNILALLGQLGHALVSWGLGGPCEASQELAPIPCPTVHVTAAGHTVVRVGAAAHTTIEVHAAARVGASMARICLR